MLRAISKDLEESLRGVRLAPRCERGAPHSAGNLLSFLSAVATLALSSWVGVGWAAPQKLRSSSERASTGEVTTKLETVTVNAQRRKGLERQVDDFVSSVVVKYWQDSLARWSTPVCPLVAGLPRQQGEFVLSRVSQVAVDAGIPLAGERCKANFYVVITPAPAELLKDWWARDKKMYHTRKGMGYVSEFMSSEQPIRVWYNKETAGGDGTKTMPGDIPELRIPEASRLRNSIGAERKLLFLIRRRFSQRTDALAPRRGFFYCN